MGQQEQQSAQHTPGSWRLDKDDLLILGPLGVRGVIAEVQSHNEAGALIPECEGNARLIAAAPDMLAALLDVLSSEPGPDLNDRVRAAVAKATGSN